MHEENLKSLATKADLQAAVADLRRELKELELRLTLRMGAMLAATIAFLAAIIKLT